MLVFAVELFLFEVRTGPENVNILLLLLLSLSVHQNAIIGNLTM